MITLLDDLYSDIEAEPGTWPEQDKARGYVDDQPDENLEDASDAEDDASDFEPPLGWTDNATGWVKDEPLEEADDERGEDIAELGIADADTFHDPALRFHVFEGYDGSGNAIARAQLQSILRPMHEPEPGCFLRIVLK